MNSEVTRIGVGVGVSDWYHVPTGTIHAAESEKETDEIEI